MSRYRPSSDQPPRNGGSGYSGYDSYQPASAPASQWDANSNRYNPDQRNDRVYRGGFSDLRRQPSSLNQDATRDSRNSFRPPQSDFSFSAPRPAGVQNTFESYRSSDRRDFGGDRSHRPRQQENSRPGQGPNRRYQTRGGSSSGRGRGGPYRPPKAADRPMLHQKFDVGELMLGDAAHRTTYRAIEDLSDDDEAAMDISGDSGSDTGQPATKRVRLATATKAEESTPKWSNADPYDALPPPAPDTQRKKVDFVQLIRKARVEPDNRSEAPKEVPDFISCDFSEDDDSTNNLDNSISNGSSSRGDNRVSKAPTGPRGASNLRRPDIIPPTVRHRAELVPSTSLGNRKRTHDDKIKLPHARLPRVTKMPPGGNIVPSWRVQKGEDPCPWAKVNHSDTKEPAHLLHKEIVDFHEYVRPRDFEDRIRQEMIDKLDALVKQKWRDATVLPFGSFSSGLYLPTADMDLVICSKRFLDGGSPIYMAKKHIHMLRSFFAQQKVAFPEDSYEMVLGAKVPLLKYCDSGTGLKVDISFEKLDGVRAVQTFLGWKKTYPAMPIIVSIIKHFLCMRGMNEPVNGGIGGFSVICLVVNLLNQIPQVQSGSMIPEHHLGEILMEFFRFYGMEHDYKNVAIRMDHRGHSELVNKGRVSNIVYRNMDRLSILDPNNSENDIAGGSSNYRMISSAFEAAYEALYARMKEVAKDPSKFNDTILSTILAGNYSSFRTQRDYMTRFDEEGLPSMMNRKSYWDQVAW